MLDCSHPLQFCAIFQRRLDPILSGATISCTPHVQGCNAAISTVARDLKHISLHLILQNQSMNAYCLQIPASKTREIENLCLQELLRTQKSWEGGEVRFIPAFPKCSKSESIRMVKGDLFILSCSQPVTWAHLDNILKVTSS